LDGFGAHLGGELAGIFGGQLAVFLFLQDLALLEDGHFALVDNDEGFEVENALEVAHGDIKQVADAAGESLEEPHVRAGRSQLNVAEALAADFAQSDFDAALVADDSAMLHALVLATQAFPVRNRTENLGAEQAIPLRLEGAVVDGLGLGDFAVRPGTDLFGTRQADANGIEVCDQTGAIIRAAAIQGVFLPALALRRGPRTGVALARLRTQKNRNANFKDLACRGAACRAPTK